MGRIDAFARCEVEMGVVGRHYGHLATSSDADQSSICYLIPRMSATTHHGTSQEGRTRGLLVVVLLAAAFALVPRLTKSCDTSGVDRDAPNFKARVVANG